MKGKTYKRGDKTARTNPSLDRQRRSIHKSTPGRPYSGDRKTYKPNRTTWVKGYTMKDGTRVRGHKRRFHSTVRKRKK